jgi:hypothetical protein
MAVDVGKRLGPYELTSLLGAGIYVRPFPGQDGKWQVSTEGGRQPVWSPSGEELFCRNGDKLMAVPINDEPEFAAGSPRVLFAGNYRGALLIFASYDISSRARALLDRKGHLREPAEPPC